MKSVLLSICPEWCKKICHEIGKDKNGKLIYEKSVEVRKTKPSIPTPFKVYIYCTKGKNGYEWLYRFDNNGYGKAQSWHGKVVGEFICDKVYSIKYRGNRYSVADEEQSVTNEIARQSCLDYDDMVSYLGNKDGYGWHISQLKIYDKPKELSEFCKVGAKSLEKLAIDDELCSYCYRTGGGEYSMIVTPNGLSACEGRFCEEAYEEYLEQEFALTRPPQSWCYVQEEDDLNVL